MAVWVSSAETHKYQVLFWHNANVLSVFSRGEEMMFAGDFSVHPPEILVLRRGVGSCIKPG
jgi:hypothetical protein